MSGVSSGAPGGVRKKKNLTEVERLELDNQRMEERLNALKESLAKQKEKRAASNKDSVWKSGQQQKGSLGAYAADVLAKKHAAAKAKRAGYAGVGKEADARRKELESSVKSKIETTEELRRQQPPPPAVPASAMQPQPPSVEAPPGRPPVRMWRVTSALDTQPPPPAVSTSPDHSLPTHHPSRSSARRVSHIPPPPDAPRRGATFINIVPSTSLDVGDHLFSAAEEGRNDGSVMVPSVSAQTEAGEQSGGRLIDGTFDEAKSHREFAEALEEWRKGRSAGASPAGGTGSSGNVMRDSASPSRRASMIPEFLMNSLVGESSRHSGSLSTGGNAGSGSSSPLSPRRGSVLPEFMTVPDTSSPTRRGSVAAAILNRTLGRERSTSEADLLPTFHDGRQSGAGGLLQARARAGSLASLGHSFANLGLSLGQALGISGVASGEGDNSRSVSDPNLHYTPPGSFSKLSVPSSPLLKVQEEGSPSRRSSVMVSPDGRSRQTGGLVSGTAAEESHGILLDGEFDEVDSHRSFLAALNEWRGVKKGDPGYVDIGESPSRRSSAIRSEGTISAATSTDSSTRTIHPRPSASATAAIEDAFAKSRARGGSQDVRGADGLTYMERLLLEKYRKEGTGASEPSSPTSQKPPAPDLEMGDAVWENQDQVLDIGEDVGGGEGEDGKGKGGPGVNNKRRDVDSNVDSDSDSDDSDEEDTWEHKYGQRADVDAKHVHAVHEGGGDGKRGSVLDIEDVTEREEEVIRGALEGGRIVECLPSDRLIVEEPED